VRDDDDDDDDSGGDDGDSNAGESGRSYSISAVHFMLRIVTHARELRGGTDIPRTLYDLRNINIFLLPTTRSYDPTSFFVPFSLCIFYDPRNYKCNDVVIYRYASMLLNSFMRANFFFSRRVTGTTVKNCDFP